MSNSNNEGTSGTVCYAEKMDTTEVSEEPRSSIFIEDVPLKYIWVFVEDKWTLQDIETFKKNNPVHIILKPFSSNKGVNYPLDVALDFVKKENIRMDGDKEIKETTMTRADHTSFFVFNTLDIDSDNFEDYKKGVENRDGVIPVQNNVSCKSLASVIELCIMSKRGEFPEVLVPYELNEKSYSEMFPQLSKSFEKDKLNFCHTVCTCNYLDIALQKIIEQYMMELAKTHTIDEMVEKFRDLADISENEPDTAGFVEGMRFYPKVSA